MPRVLLMLQRRSAQVAALSPVQCAATAPVPKKLDLIQMQSNRQTADAVQTLFLSPA